MRPSPLPPAKVEQIVGYLRVFGIVFGVPVIVLADFPDLARTVLIWSVQGLLVAGTLALWVWARRGPLTLAILHAGFALDCLVITGYVLAFAHLTPNVAWAMVFTILADASLRYGVRGAVLGYVISLALFVAQGQLRAATIGLPLGWVPYLYVGGTLVGVAGVLAAFSYVVDQQTDVMQQQALRLADVQRVRERLVATSSHEFRGSLTAVMAGVDTVRVNLDRLDPDRVQSILTEVLRQSRQLQRLVDDLLAVAQADREGVGLRSRPGDIAETVALAVAAAGRHREDHRLEVSVPRVSCELDHERLQQVVRNLVENAFKYTPPDGRVEVVVRHSDGRLDLRVADSGAGIPAADRERIFEPFRRRTEAEGAEGLGLGLYLVRQIVDAMGGSIELSTSPEGAEFVVQVPATPCPTADDDARQC